ncbi:murein hydrolase activator EnvC family protein [Kribbella sp. C-35]|uniref:murein hydrolase activator EnvC family protein n=1 Tax=Kribbella sp. C-35 TaxID=2789276 RepID=UPI00397E71D9
MNLALLPLAAPPPPPTPSPPPPAVAAWPLQPRPEVVRGFELPAKPWLPGHRGVDLAGRPGQPVLAATAGTITYAGALAGRGVVTITTGPRRTTYEPVVPEVSVGTAVKTGTVIGRLSAAGSHCLPRSCLHWGLLQGKQYLNPLTLLPNRPVRLLPLTDRQTQPAAAASPGTSPDLSRGMPPAPASDGPPDSSGRAAKLVIAATAALTLTAGLLIRRE